MFFVCVLAVPPPLPGVQLRLRSGHVSFKSIPEEPTEGDKVEEVAKEMGEVISGLAEFKTELLQLHAMVRRGGGGRVVWAYLSTFSSISQSPLLPQLLRNSDGVETSPTHEGEGEQGTPVRGNQALSTLPSTTPTFSTPTPSTLTPSTLVSSTALKEKEKEVRNDCHGNGVSAKKLL